MAICIKLKVKHVTLMFIGGSSHVCDHTHETDSSPLIVFSVFDHPSIYPPIYQFIPSHSESRRASTANH